jgi:hypothetical protein
MFIAGIIPQPPIPVTTRSKGVGLRPSACWDRGFESHRGGMDVCILYGVCVVR